MANISVPSPRKLISDTFGKKYTSTMFCLNFGFYHFLQKNNEPHRLLRGVCQAKKGSYIDPLVMMDSHNFEFFVDICHQTLSFC